MNRAERRKRQKLGLPISKEPCYNMTSSQLNSMKEEITNEAVVDAFTLMLAIPVKVMYEKYGWGMKKRLPEFAEAILEEYEHFQNDEISARDYEELVYQYCGIKFRTEE